MDTFQFVKNLMLHNANSNSFGFVLYHFSLFH